MLSKLKGTYPMRRLFILLACLIFPAVSLAQNKQGKAFLVLNAGGHTARVAQVAFSPDGRELISTSDDRTIRFWDIKSGEVRRIMRLPVYEATVGGHSTSALSPDGRTLASYCLKKQDHWIDLIDIASGRVTGALRGHGDWI